MEIPSVILNANSLPERLKQLRINKGLTLKEAAKYSYIGFSALSKFETGKREPRIDILMRLSELYGVTLDYLINGVEVSNMSSEFEEEIEAEEKLVNDNENKVEVIGQFPINESDLKWILLGRELKDRTTPERVRELFRAIDEILNKEKKPNDEELEGNET